MPVDVYIIIWLKCVLIWFIKSDDSGIYALLNTVYEAKVLLQKGLVNSSI